MLGADGPRARFHPQVRANWATLAFTVPRLRPQPSQRLGIERLSQPASSHGKTASAGARARGSIILTAFASVRTGQGKR
jgi:hypothetical protein